jgi:hypothetical protein
VVGRPHGHVATSPARTRLAAAARLPTSSFR